MDTKTANQFAMDAITDHALAERLERLAAAPKLFSGEARFDLLHEAAKRIRDLSPES